LRGKPIDAIPVPLGQRRETPTRRRKKLCKVCGKTLSIYNENKYCFVHIMRGYELEKEIADEKKFTSYRKHLKKMNQQNKEKKRVPND